MSVKCNAIKSVFIISYLRIRYGKCFTSPILQAFDHLKIELRNGGHIRFGNRIQNRGYLYLICDNSGELSIGNHVFFNTNCSVTCMEKVSIGDYCKFGNNLVIVDHDHNFKSESPEFISKEIKIGNRVWCGANCTILKGSSIGDDCVIAAGSVVRGNIPSKSIYMKNGEIREI